MDSALLEATFTSVVRADLAPQIVLCVFQKRRGNRRYGTEMLHGVDETRVVNKTRCRRVVKQKLLPEQQARGPLLNVNIPKEYFEHKRNGAAPSAETRRKQRAVEVQTIGC
jgi:hypothetical protein